MRRIASPLLLLLVSRSVARVTAVDDRHSMRTRRSSYLRLAREADPSADSSRHLQYNNGQYSGGYAGEANDWDSNTAYQQALAESEYRHGAPLPKSGQLYSTSKGSKTAKGSKATKGSKGSSKLGKGSGVYPVWPAPTGGMPVHAPTGITFAPFYTRAPVNAPTVPAPTSTGFPPSQQFPDFLPDYSFDRYKDKDPTGAEPGVVGPGVSDEFTAASEPFSPGDWMQDVQLTDAELQVMEAADNPEYTTEATVSIQSTCSLGSTGFYGTALGTVYEISFIYQALLTSDATEDILKSEIAPALDTGIPEAMLPSFFSECSSGGRRLQMVAPSIEGISRMQTDYVVTDPDCKWKLSFACTPCLYPLSFSSSFPAT